MQYEAEQELANASDATAIGSISLSFAEAPASVPALGPLGAALLSGLLGVAIRRSLQA
jgi:hypothetical protein